MTEQEEQWVKDELTAVDTDEWYEQALRELYGDVEVCGCSYDAATIWKEIDPVAYRCGKADMLDAYSDEFVEVDGEYYKKDEVEELLEDKAEEEADKDEDEEE